MKISYAYEILFGSLLAIETKGSGRPEKCLMVGSSKTLQTSPSLTTVVAKHTSKFISFKS